MKNQTIMNKSTRNGGCNEAKTLVFFKKSKGVVKLDPEEVKLAASIQGCKDGKVKFKAVTTKLLKRVQKELGTVNVSDIPIPPWDPDGIAQMTSKMEQRKAKEAEYQARGEVPKLKKGEKRPKTPMLIPDDVIKEISSTDYEKLWENYQKGFKKGWDKKSEEYGFQRQAIVDLLRKKAEIEEESEEAEETEEPEEGFEEEGEIEEEQEENEIHATKHMGKKKKEWKRSDIVGEFLEWSKRNYDLEHYYRFERRINLIKFDDDLLIHLDVQTDLDELGPLITAITKFVMCKWKPDYVFDIIIKFT